MPTATPPGFTSAHRAHRAAALDAVRDALDAAVARRTLDAELRALEAGRNAVAQGDGSFLVLSTDGTRHYRVTYFGDTAGVVRFNCTCAYGERNHDVAVGCKHMAAAGRSLARRDLALQNINGLFVVPGWTAPEPLDDLDPFEGLLDPTAKIIATVTALRGARSFLGSIGSQFGPEGPTSPSLWRQIEMAETVLEEAPDDALDLEQAQIALEEAAANRIGWDPRDQVNGRDFDTFEGVDDGDLF